jgi:small subunit ribosomal protein S13
MPRILNVNIPNDKTIGIGLTQIEGIGLTRAHLICSELKIPKNKRFSYVSKEKLKLISDFIDNNFIITSKLKREKKLNIKSLINMSSYKGFRHVKGLPVRGQRTKTNSKNSRKIR